LRATVVGHGAGGEAEDRDNGGVESDGLHSSVCVRQEII
jgi:hypothetical protein